MDTRSDRHNEGERRVIWFTGLPGSGKTTLSRALGKAFHERGFRAYVLDADDVRHGLNKNLGFSPEDRHENVRRIGEVARMMADAGLICLVACISPYAADRRLARQMNPAGTFVEVFCKCPVQVCEQRDPKGLYRRARAGQVKGFTGLDAPYEQPENPELTVFTADESVAASVAKILAYLGLS